MLDAQVAFQPFRDVFTPSTGWATAIFDHILNVLLDVFVGFSLGFRLESRFLSIGLALAI